MKTKEQIMAEFDQAIKSLKEWVEAEPVEPPKDGKWFRYVNSTDLILVDQAEYNNLKEHWNATKKPVDSEPEWVGELKQAFADYYGHEQQLNDGEIRVIADFIRTEIIERICEEIKKELDGEVFRYGCSLKDGAEEPINRVKNRWLKGEK